jgi:hypothetical protein
MAGVKRNFGQSRLSSKNKVTSNIDSILAHILYLESILPNFFLVFSFFYVCLFVFPFLYIKLCNFIIIALFLYVTK